MLHLGLMHAASFWKSSVMQASPVHMGVPGNIKCESNPCLVLVRTSMLLRGRWTLTAPLHVWLLPVTAAEAIMPLATLREACTKRSGRRCDT